jgi:hypothetical protein
MTLTVQAPAKINLHLEVLGLRPDGYHELAMVMQSLDLADSLRFTPTADGTIVLECDRPDLSTGPDNLIVKAAQMLRARAGLPELGAHIALTKRIPIGAGLAGAQAMGRPPWWALTRCGAAASLRPICTPWPRPSAPTCPSASRAAPGSALGAAR